MKLIPNSPDRLPRLTLVGAGPGDPELLTLKAYKALQEADVVLFDALVSEDILDMIPAETPRLAVGKRAAQHSFAQEEINELCVEMAFLYGHVVRLKGGDPFVFGRGIEEITYAHRHGVGTHVIPGITSAVSVPGLVGIPVTARGISESFWVITGTTESGALSRDIALAAKSTATVVILMGLHRLHEITDIFCAAARCHTPAAIIQSGTLASQKVVISNVANLCRVAEEEGIGSPATIVVGEVVQYANEFKKILTLSSVQQYE